MKSDFLQFLYLTCGYSTTVIRDLGAFLQFVQLSPTTGGIGCRLR